MDGTGNKLLPSMGKPRSLRKREDRNLGRCTTREAIASCMGQVCSAAPAVSRQRRRGVGHVQWAVGQSGRQEEGNFPFHPPK